ncbi:MAG: hypothetical protein K2N16_05655 [Muribaculaceae bacterium]|nr:hypothetical protein [Muribaculaceae bacterium]
MKRQLVLIISLLVCACSMAQTIDFDDGRSHWEADVLIGLNNDGYEFGLGAAYFPFSFIGIKANIGMAGEIEELEDWGIDYWDPDYGDAYYWEKNYDYAARFKFSPALVLRTPRIAHWKRQDAGFYLFAEPGLSLSPGASGSRGARWFNWDFKGGVNMQIDRFIVFVGYGFSSFSLYSGFPTSHWGAPSKDNYTTHFGFIGTAYKF